MGATVTNESSLDEIARILDSANVIVHGFDGVVTRWTSGSEGLYGWSRAEARGRAAHDLLETVFPQPFAEIVAHLKAHGVWTGELSQRRKDGTPVSVASRWVVAETDGESGTAIIETNVDVSDLRTMQAHLVAR
ncbi:MAG: PAS domain-containing protein, partial [Beijerinckiaceae bacterium]|nr:PAS domain-containing protein [Beijerinckiaceae bacterium]